MSSGIAIDHASVLDPEPRPHAARRLSVAMIGLRGIPATHGGVELAVEEVSAELAARGHDVTVYNRTAYSEARVETHRGVQLRSLPQINTKHLESASHTLLSVVDAVAARRYDILHIHATGPALFSVLPRLVGQPVVVTVHGEDWRREKWGLAARTVLRGGLRIAATVPDRTIVVSAELQRHLSAAFGTDCVFIPNGVDPSRFEVTTPVAGLEPERYLLFLGRLVPEKGIHHLLRAFARTDLPHRLVIAGPGTHSAAYVEELRALAAADPRVLLAGPIYGAEKAWLLKNASLVVQPSTLEGMPIVLLEAAACGRPCLVSDIPEHLEVVRQRGALLAATFPSGDEDAFVSALTDAVRSPDPRRVEAFKTLVLDRYQWKAIAADTEQVYYDALATRSEHTRSRTTGRRERGR